MRCAFDVCEGEGVELGELAVLSDGGGGLRILIGEGDGAYGGEEGVRGVGGEGEGKGGEEGYEEESDGERFHVFGCGYVVGCGFWRVELGFMRRGCGF